MIARRDKFFSGLWLLIGFLIVLVVMFLPIFKGHNAIEYLDNIFNSISKGSANYIPKVREEITRVSGIPISVALPMDDVVQAEQTALLFEKSGCSPEISGKQLTVSGDLGRILENSLQDAHAMYWNQGASISDKYGYPAERVMYNWWATLQSLEKGLTRQKQFEAARVVDHLNKKAVETAYNYYGIDPQKISDRWGVVLFSLLFYVTYTLWFGFSILYLFEGWGLRLGH